MGVVCSEVGDCGAGVGGDTFQSGPRDVLLVSERVVPLADAGCSAKVIDGHRVIAMLGETQCQLLVEMMKTANVGEDHHPGTLALDARRSEGGEPIPVDGGQDKVPARGTTLDGIDGWPGIAVVTHRVSDWTR
jgi:hypothetical protein